MWWKLWLSSGIFVTILITIIVLAFFYKVFKTILKYFLAVTLLIVIVIGIVGYMTYRDIADLRENLMKEDNLFILQNNNQVLAGFSMNIDDLKDLKDFNDISLNYLTPNQILQYNVYYNKGQYKKMLGENYKIFFVNYDLFKDISDISVSGESFENDFLLMVLESSNPINILKDEFMRRGQKSSSIGANLISDDLKAKIFLMLLIKKMEKEKSPLFLITELDTGKIKVYPETMTFKVLDYIPTSFIKNKFSSLT